MTFCARPIVFWIRHRERGAIVASLLFRVSNAKMEGNVFWGSTIQAKANRLMVSG